MFMRRFLIAALLLTAGLGISRLALTTTARAQQSSQPKPSPDTEESSEVTAGQTVAPQDKAPTSAPQGAQNAAPAAPPQPQKTPTGTPQESVNAPSATSQQETTGAVNSPQQSQTPPGPSITAETREVRVDVVVTDKKGNYVQDLTTKDFKLYEDSKEQAINSFSFGADPNGPMEAQRHYIVLFFDNSSMDLSDQPRARAAAGKFIDAYAGPDRVMSVMNFGGTLRIAQNFTTDAARLKQAVSGLSTSSVSPSNSAATGAAATGGAASNIPGSSSIPGPSTAGLQAGVPSLGNAEGDFGAYTLLLSIRRLAKNLAAIPGRKSLVLFTAGFELSPERFSELTATIDTCNKANVAVYPLDVRGLVTPMSQVPRRDSEETWSSAQNTRSGWNPDRLRAVYTHATPVAAGSQSPAAALQLAAFHPGASPMLVALQHGGGGGGGGGGGHGGGGGGTGGGGTGGGGTGGSGGSGGGHGGTGGGGTGGTGGGHGGTPPGVGNYGNYNYNQTRQIVPPFPTTSTTNQQVMYVLASGTGGFPILNTNDLLPGLEKIAREQSQYYLLGYTPGDSPTGSCHTLKVKVERGGANVRARSGFCNVQPSDPLAGKPIEKELETRASAPAAALGAGPVGPGSLEAPFFYTSPNEARVHLAMELPTSSIDFAKVKGKYHAEVNVLGIAYRPDGTVASRFSDEVTLDMEKDVWEKFIKAPMHYENQFSVAPGQYKLSVVFSGGGQKFASYQTPLAIDSYDGKKFSLSAVALSNQVQPVSNMGGALDADLLADRAPLVVRDLELTPSGSNHFKRTDKAAVYAQIYVPRLADTNPPTVKCALVISDPKTGKSVAGAADMDMTSYIQKGSPVIPVVLKLPLDSLAPGEYLLRLQATEGPNDLTQVRAVHFVVE
jgi:VWFA-related protein